MKLLSMMLIIGAFIMGIYDGDSTAAVILMVLLAPVIFEKRREIGEEKCQQREV